MSVTGRHEVTDEPDAPVIGPLVLTHTELELLERAHRRLLGEGTLPGPPVEEDDEGRREARRSLVARGLLDGDGELPEDDDLALVVATALDIRVAASRVLLVQRVVAGDGTVGTSTGEDVSRGTRLVHLVDSGACVEDVLADGSHHLYLVLDEDQVVGCVTDVTVPPDAVEGTDPGPVVDPLRPEAMAVALGRPSVLVELAVLTPATTAPAVPPTTGSGKDATGDDSTVPRHHLLALGPSGCWLTEVEPGRELPGSVVFRPVHPGWVGEWVRSVLAPGAGQGTRRPAHDGEHMRPTPARGAAAGRREDGGEQGTMSG